MKHKNNYLFFKNEQRLNYFSSNLVVKITNSLLFLQYFISIIYTAPKYKLIYLKIKYNKTEQFELFQDKVY